MNVSSERLDALVKQYKRKHPRASKKLATFCVLDELATNISNEKYFALMERHGFDGDTVIKLNEERGSV